MSERLREIAGPEDLRQLHREHPSRYPFLLQSTAHGGVLGRFDILFACPGDAVVARAGTRFLDELDACWSRERIPAVHSELPFLGGWFLYLGYELARQIETGLALKEDPVLPAAFAVRCPVAVIYDHAEEQAWLVAEAGQDDNLDTLRGHVAMLSRDTTTAAASLTDVSVARLSSCPASATSQACSSARS